MSKTGLLIARVFLSILLVVSLVMSIFIFSVYQNVNEDTYDEQLADLAYDIINEKVKQEEGRLEGFNSTYVHNKLSDLCVGQESIFVDEIGFEVSCDEINSANPSGIRELLVGKVVDKTKQEIQEKILEPNGQTIDVLFSTTKILS
jgi:hypothetical protein